MNALIVDQFNKLIKQIKAEYLNAQLENNIKETEIQSYRSEKYMQMHAFAYIFERFVFFEHKIFYTSSIEKPRKNI